MLPVALVLVGSGLPPPTVAFIGWFGPRGLASIIFALIALEELHSEADRVVAVIGMTVLLSVAGHGLSAKPFAARYGEKPANSRAVRAGAPETPVPVRGLLHGHPAAASQPPREDVTG
jgi:NhaP-type Na+/H+ or K+/H+ antiporter